MDWNVVVSVAEHHYQRAREVLGQYGPVAKTEFYNVLVMQVGDGLQLLALLTERGRQDREINSLISRVLPVSQAWAHQLR